MKLVLLLSLMLLALSGDSTAQNTETFRFVRREVPWGQSVNMEEFGGPRVEVSVRSRQINFVSVDIADFTRMIPVLVNDATIYGPSRVVMQPSRETRRIERKNGAQAPGGRSDMYLLHVDPVSGTQVYFSDEAAGQNRDVLIIGTPREAPGLAERFRPRPPKPEKPAPRSRLHADGYLSDKLLDWYLRLEAKRDRLDLKDTAAVQRFNEEAARYQAELQRARAFAGAK
jgi:hypothetical protein